MTDPLTNNPPTDNQLTFIGKIQTPYQRIEECPNNIQTDGPLCTIELLEEYKDGLLGLKQGQKILILYWFENVNRNALQQSRKTGGEALGTFALRSPHRPNPIGAAELIIEKIENNKITVKGLDCLNQTNLIDIKPAI